MDPRRENRVLRVTIVLLAGVLLAGVSSISSQTQQRFPGPGGGVVDVNVVDKVPSVQHGEWRVAQQGEWRVGVQGTVATLPSMPPIVAVNRTYDVRWPGMEAAQRVVVRELHASGWARVSRSGAGGSHWANLAVAATIEPQ